MLPGSAKVPLLNSGVGDSRPPSIANMSSRFCRSSET
jgi:hypothetical protein